MKNRNRSGSEINRPQIINDPDSENYLIFNKN